MEKKAAELMGEPIQAGSIIATKGHISKLALGGGGLVGGLLSGVLAAKMKPPTTPGNHQGLVYMAVGESRVVFFSVKQGFFSQSIESIIAEHPRADVAAMEIESGVIPKIQFVLNDGTNYALECGMIFMGKVKNIKAALDK